MAAPGQMGVETIEVQAPTVPVRAQRLGSIEKRDSSFFGDAPHGPIRCVEVDFLGIYLDGIVFDSPLSVVLIHLLAYRKEKQNEADVTLPAEGLDLG